MRILRDKAKTRVNLEAVTSYSSDYDLLPPNSRVDNIILSIGSAVRKLTYNDVAVRDADIKELDDHFNVDSGIR